MIRSLQLSKKAYLLIGAGMIIVSSVLSYFVATRWSSTPIPIAPPYFIIAMVVVLALEIPILLGALRLAKIQDRTFPKMFFTVAGANLINSLFAVSRAPFTPGHEVIAFFLSLLAGVATWFFVKNVYMLTHKETGRLAFRLAIILAMLAIVVGLIGSMLFTAKIKQMGM